MNLFELLFFIAAIICAIFGATYLSQFGVAAAVGGGVAGLTAPFLLGQVVCWIDDIRFSRTREGRRRSIAEAEFDRQHDEKRISSFRARPRRGKDGSFVVTIYYGNTRPPLRSFYRFSGDSMTPEEITGVEAQNYIDVPQMR
ncbi:hypothetical protein [Haloferula sp.]|uniref:hypothetical protein n=1 Tax=Haloferula sp. TaxID=2497595 RepID=UPI003C774DB9